jgi:putative membrane protein
MINRFSDHAANERTFLAWIRTAIAVMAFGFLVERFDLFIRFASRGAAGASPPHSGVANAVGLLFVTMGMATMVIAAVRFSKLPSRSTPKRR